MAETKTHERLPNDIHKEVRYRSHCSCGWRSTPYTAEAAADDAYRFHAEWCERDLRPSVS